MGTIQTLHDTGNEYQITPKMDGGVYSLATVDCVIQGIGDEFALQYTSSSLDVQFNAGSEAVIGGAFFKIMALTSVTLPANSTIYLCANIDLSKASGETGGFVQRTASSMVLENLNGSGTSRDLLLYVISTGATGVTSVTDRRSIRATASPVTIGTSTTTFLRNDGQWVAPLTYGSSTTKYLRNDGQWVAPLTYGSSTTTFLRNNGTWGAPAYSSLTGVPANVTNLGANGQIPYLTSAPTSANTTGLKIVYLTSEPTTKYAGYIYLIKE